MIVHRNGNTPLIDMIKESNLVMKDSEAVLMKPVGSTKNLEVSVLKE